LVRDFCNSDFKVSRSSILLKDLESIRIFTAFLEFVESTNKIAGKLKFKFKISFESSSLCKNAEGFKFLSLAGAEAFLKDLQKRGMIIEEVKKN
jgi:hypothetical protein